MSSRIQYRVPYADTDQMGVVYYANYLVMFERVRNEILRDCGFSYDQIEKSGIGLPVIQAHVDYYKPSHYDDLLNITGWFEKVSGARAWVRCQVHRNQDLLAEGHTIHVFLDLNKKKPVKPDKTILKAIKIGGSED